MLYAPELHEQPTDTPWDAGRVRDGIRAIVADADSVYDPDALWPADEWDGWKAALPLKNLYAGASGVVWALDALRRRGHAESQLDLAEVAHRTLAAFRRTPDLMADEALPEPKESSLLCGETGPLLVAWRLRADRELGDALHERIVANLGNEANELMWGVPGTLLAARAMLDWTGDERWREAVRESELALLAARDAEGLWTQQLYGSSARYLGPVHGLVGNVAALQQVGNAADVLARHAILEDGRANWPPTLSSTSAPRLQWCHGAPGIVTHAANYLDGELLLAGTELVWEAGPLHSAEKGAGLCHGTAGNGYAFLRAFERTGDELWLERARAFAVHALEQVERLPGRYSLFTGGVGAALFAADCLDGVARFPVLDGWD